MKLMRFSANFMAVRCLREMTLLQRVLDKQFSKQPRTHHRKIDWRRFLNRPLFAPWFSDAPTHCAGKTVLITGAGGSIGSSLSLLLMGGLARNLVLLDHSEANLRALHRLYRQRNLTLPRVEFIRADVRCKDQLEEVFARYEPHIVFHAAAMKHLVPLESDPFAALENNLLGTLQLLEIAHRSRMECFVNVSTDKAVVPTSILGVSKRLAELLLLAVDSEPRKVSLRLGNVLESAGSVVPLFIQSLENCQPLRITSADASRYFLTLEEAATFLLAAQGLGENSLLLEMGNPRRIIELAGFLLEEFDCPRSRDCMSFIGLRDGEKSCEQLTYRDEHLEHTTVSEIYRICGGSISDPEQFTDDLEWLLELVNSRETHGLIDVLVRLVPEFEPSPTLLRYVC